MFFKNQTVYHYRPTPPAGNWGDPTLVQKGILQVTVQPFTGDDHTVNDQFSEDVREMITIPDVNYDIKFDDRLVYDGTMHKVIYRMKCDAGLIPHLEIFIADSAEAVPVWRK
jgi:hypothetical protein